jgi:hypothetical protein
MYQYYCRQYSVEALPQAATNFWSDAALRACSVVVEDDEVVEEAARDVAEDKQK